MLGPVLNNGIVSSKMATNHPTCWYLHSCVVPSHTESHLAYVI